MLKKQKGTRQERMQEKQKRTKQEITQESMNILGKTCTRKAAKNQAKSTQKVAQNQSKYIQEKYHKITS